MKKSCALSVATLLLAAAFLTGCIREVIPEVDDRYTSFPEAEILGASFYYQLNGQDVSGDEAGMISKNDDGTYHVKMRRRSPSTSPSAMFITGPFVFSEFYKIVCTFPDDPAIVDKPYRLYACASVGMDGNTDADYPTANDLNGEAVFRNGVAIGTFEMTNEGINYLNVADPVGRNRPYITVFLYLYFNNVSDPDDWYEFALDFAGGANGKIPESTVTRAEIYREGDTENSLKPVMEQYTFINDGVVKNEEFILAEYNHRLDSNKQFESIPAIDTQSLYIDLQVPDEYLNQDIEFELRGIGFYADDSAANLITRTMMTASTFSVQAGTSTAEQTGIVTEERIPGNPPTYYYVIKAKAVRYNNLFGTAGTGVKLVFAMPNALTNDRFTCTIMFSEKELEEGEDN